MNELHRLIFIDAKTEYSSYPPLPKHLRAGRCIGCLEQGKRPIVRERQDWPPLAFEGIIDGINGREFGHHRQ